MALTGLMSCHLMKTFDPTTSPSVKSSKIQLILLNPISLILTKFRKTGITGKRVWNLHAECRQCTRNKDPMPLLKTAEGEHLTDDRAKADHLSEYFSAFFSSETGFNPSALQSFEDTPIIETVQFTEGMVLTELMRLKESKSPGPDEIPAKILKELAGELSKPLSMLFHTSFETGCLPPDWRSAWITPLYKGGSRVSANNYRPVSLTSICCSVLGPTLFLVYVNDCANELNCDVAMFADDIKIWRTIRSEVDEARLQTNLDHLEQLSKDWPLPFNVNKYNFLRVSRTSSPNHTIYRLTGKPLQEVDAQKDLGVWITTSLKPSLQCSKVAKSAMSIIYLVKRAFPSFDEDCFAKVFQTFVRPHLEFAIQAWRPWTAKDFGILEKVQRRATKLVSGQWSLPYETRLANLALFPLSYRQLSGDLIQAFRIVRNQGCCLASGDFFELATTTNLRGHPLKLRVTGARMDTRKFFFSNKVVAAWNALPEDVVMS
ncbi:hypothetical protein SprV_0902762200 [Sparganum proliferum]